MTYHHGNLRKSLLDRAAQVIAESGVEALSLRALARDIGVSHAAPARHFKDKKALLSALATEGNKRLTTAVTDAANAMGTDPLARYNAMGKAVIRFSLEHPAFYATFNHPDVLHHSDDKLNAAQAEYMEMVKQAAAAAQAAGWRQDQDLMTVLTFSSAAALGTANMFTNPHVGGVLEGVDLIALAESVIDLVVPPSTAALHAHQET